MLHLSVIGSYRCSNCKKNTIQEPLLFIVTDIARDDEALQATTRVNNPKCKRDDRAILVHRGDGNDGGLFT
jgi:DNA-directed RNA polymerase subunit RPC12/RpoP